MAKKNVAYHCPPKQCPRPADFARFPELMALVRAEYAKRMKSQFLGKYPAASSYEGGLGNIAV